MPIVVTRFPSCPALGADFAAAPWATLPPAAIATAWDGSPVPASLMTSARLGWSHDHLWIGYECAYAELDMDDAPDTGVERAGLWERDVCEAFIQSPAEPHGDSYKEFEVGPSGQWCDLAIHRPRVDVDLGWQSGMATAAAIDHDRRVWRAVMRIPFTALGVVPRAGDRWRANLFRIGRIDGERRYLAFAPTGTPAPDFHVPARFVPLVFA